MYIVLVTIRVKPDCIEPFIAATRDNHLHTRQEPGNRRFDVVQLNGDPCSFRYYEAYVDEGAFKAHQQTAHYFRWRDTVEPFMAERRVGERGTSIMPEPWH